MKAVNATELMIHEAEESANHIEWFISPINTTYDKRIGIDWEDGTIFIIDGDHPDYPVLEIAQFDGIDILYDPKEDN